MCFRSCALLLGMAVLMAMIARGGQPGAVEEPRYDTGTVVSVSAAVTDLREVPRGGMLPGLHLIVTTDKDSSLEVFVAPMTYLKELQVAYARGDRLEITGSKVKSGAGTIMLVREVRRDSDTVYFRDSRGKPYWSGGPT